MSDALTHSVCPYAAILVATDLSAHAKHRLALAFDLADRFSSHVIGIAAREIQLPYYADGSAVMVPDIVDLELKQAAKEIGEAEALFREAAGARSAIEWRNAVTPSGSYFAEQGRAADLAIVGSQDALDDRTGGMAIDPGDAVMATGRPVLVVPPGISRINGHSVIVAWSNAREARRAVLDSLPFLTCAEEVWIVAVGKDADEEGAKDVAAHLIRHGVNAKVSIRTTSSFLAGEEIVRAAQQTGADLIVAGAYGHSRIQEWAFGGVTRHLMRHSPVACLLVH